MARVACIASCVLEDDGCGNPVEPSSGGWGQAVIGRGVMVVRPALLTAGMHGIVLTMEGVQ